MRRLPILVSVLLLCLLVDPAVAEIYKWTDQTGRVHFTQDLSKIPARYRRQAGEQAAKRSTSKSPVQSYSSQPPASRQSSSSRSGQSQQGAGETYSIRVSQAGTSMLVNVKLNNSVTAPFLIDTGASDVVVPVAVAKRLGLKLEGARTQRYTTANGVIEQAVLMLRSVALGDAVVKDVPASVSDSMSVGLLGLSFFTTSTPTSTRPRAS
jgi:clan AA aspartic protease (TIGR02281 family)